MSVSDLWREVSALTAETFRALAGWLLVAPLCALMPRRKDWVAVIGREDGKFTDNTKYFFIEASQDSSALRLVHVTERMDTIKWVRDAGLEALHFPSVAAILFLARCGSVVVDSIEWPKRSRRFILVGARRIQLWHGIGFKRIELDKWKNEAPSRNWMASRWLRAARHLRKRLNGRIITYDAVVTTSAFYRDQVFRSALPARSYPVLGYPRNSFGQIDGVDELVWSNVDIPLHRLDSWRSQGKRIVLVAPTFRDTRATPMGLDQATMLQIDDFCQAHGIELLFKFHPYERGATDISGRHLHVLKPDSDVYPIFPKLDAMVTDYSSIYMDFLLLDRPIFFLTPDLEQYVDQDRSIQFEYSSMTPGPKVATWRELQLTYFEDSPEWASKRMELKQLAFKTPAPCATAAILNFMSQSRWIPQFNRT